MPSGLIGFLTFLVQPVDHYSQRLRGDPVGPWATAALTFQSRPVFHGPLHSKVCVPLNSPLDFCDGKSFDLHGNTLSTKHFVVMLKGVRERFT